MSSANDRPSNAPALRAWLKRLLLVIVVIEGGWLLAINTALSLSVTQDLLNQIRPEKFQLRWARAWSWYPGQVTLIQPFASGQSRRQQWQASVDRVDARVALLPLLIKRVHIPSGTAYNADYRQRPRLKPDTDYTALLAHFPDIEGYDVAPVSDRPLPDRRPWKTILGDVEITGSHSVWIYQFRAEFNAELGGGMSVVSRGGPLEMDIDEIDIDLTGAWVNTDQSMLDRGHIRGQFGFVPFRPREHRGLPMLQFARADLEVRLNTQRLNFIDVFLVNFEGVNVDGNGAVTGRLVFDQGRVESGTSLHIDADDLRVKALALDVSGMGDIELGVAEAPDSPLLMDFSFRDLAVQHEEDDAPLLQGESLGLQLSGSRDLDLAAAGADFNRTIAVSVEDLTVPNLARFQRFVPGKWPFRMVGGEGQLGGQGVLGPNTLSVDFNLASEHADIAVGAYRFGTNLDGTLRLENPDVLSQPTQISGTGLRLSESTLRRQEGETTQSWEASLEVGAGQLALVPAEDKQQGRHAFDLIRVLSRKDSRALLDESAGEVEFEAAVSSLAFLDVLLTSEKPAKIRGDGRVLGQIVLAEGLPDVGTRVNIQSESLGVTVMDYFATGDGEIELNVMEGGAAPEWQLGVQLVEGTMNRLGDGADGIEDVKLLLDAVLKDVSLDQPPRDFDMRFQIPSARVPDMGIFNGYLPADAPLSFEGGTAALELDLRLREDDAQGYVRLAGRGIEADLNDQAVKADLAANFLVVGGTPRDMIFNLDGSTIDLSNVHVRGVEQAFDDEAWSARLLFERAETTWRKPPVLDIEAQLSMSDSRPFVALMENHGGPPFVDRVLAVDDIQGTASLTAANHRIRVPSLEVTSDDITVAMKALIGESEREGMLFMRWKALRALLKLQNGKRNVDVINSRSTFDRYEPPQ